MGSLAAFCTIPCNFKTGPPKPISVLRCAVSSSPSKTDDDTSVPSLDSKFSAWAKENKIEMSSLVLTSFGNDPGKSLKGSRGMTALSALKKGDQLISVGRSAVLQVTSLDRNRCPIPAKISQATWQNLPWYARLALLLINAKLDSQSKLQSWIARLPSSFETPFHWTEKELLELQSPRMTKAIHDQRKLYRKLYDEINGSADNALARVMKYSDFVWAVECIRSRAFAGPLEVAPFKERLRLFLFILTNTVAWPSLHLLSWENALNVYDIIMPKILKVVQGVELRRFAMTPGIDFINHSPSVTGKAEVSYEYFSDKFVVQAGEEYETGDQVFISYGAQSNDSLLQYYGFVESENPVETYVFGSDVEGVLGVQEGSLIARRASGFDEKAILAVATKLGGNKDSARTALRNLCVAELAQMQTSLEEDLEMLSRGDCENDPRLKLAVRYRVEKKGVLKHALQ